MKRIMAVIGIVLLLSIYVITFIFALMKSPASTGWFLASFFSTIAIPVLVYGYTLVYKYLKKRNQHSTPDGKEASESDSDNKQS